MRILVIPENLRLLASQVEQTAFAIERMGQTISQAAHSLDWEVRRQVEFESGIQNASQQARRLAEEGQMLARFLREAAARFEQADSQSVQALTASFSSRPPALPWPGWLAFPLGELASLQNALGGWLGNFSLPVSVLIPAGGASLAGLAALSGFPLLSSALQDLAERLWNWLYGYGWRTNAEMVSSAVPTLPKGKAAETILNGLERAQPAQSSSSGTVVQRLHVDDNLPASSSASPSVAVPVPPAYGHNVPAFSQQGLKYGNAMTQYGCSPTAAAMVLAYWHQQDNRHPMRTPQELLDLNVQQGQFSPTGMSVSHIVDDAKNLGYTTIGAYTNATWEQLREDVQKGPVVVIVKLGMKSSGYNHAVVLNGISDDGAKVLITDPWDGQRHEYDAQTFLASWGAFETKNNYMVIRP